jgi:hypothetical protein
MHCELHFPLVIYICHHSMDEPGTEGGSRLYIFERLHNTQLGQGGREVHTTEIDT